MCIRQKDQRHLLPSSYTPVGKNSAPSVVPMEMLQGKTREYMFRVGGSVLLVVGMENLGKGLDKESQVKGSWKGRSGPGRGSPAWELEERGRSQPGPRRGHTPPQLHQEQQSSLPHRAHPLRHPGCFGNTSRRDPEINRQ